MNSFILFIIGLPALEIFIMIKMGFKIGALNTIGLIFLTAVIGVYFARLQGVQTLKSAMISLYQNKIPVYELLSGASIGIAALLLIVPGFFTDFIGFLFLIPFTRKIIFSIAFKNKKEVKINNKDDTIDGEIVDNKDEL